MKIPALRFLIAGMAVLLTLSASAWADGPSIGLSTAYCFAGHFAPCDGGLATVSNHGSDSIFVDSIVASGWLSGHTDDITALGGPSGGTQTIAAGGSLTFNSFLFNSGDDTSNDGAVADPSKGIIFTITVHDTADSTSSTFIFYDNATSHYSFIDGPGVALTGADCDIVDCAGGANNVGDPSNPGSNPVPSAPEPGSLVLLGSGLLGLAGMLRRKRS